MGREEVQVEKQDFSGCTPLSSFWLWNYVKILYVGSGYTAQADLEFLSPSNPPASGTITKVRGVGGNQQVPRHKCTPKNNTAECDWNTGF